MLCSLKAIGLLVVVVMGITGLLVNMHLLDFGTDEAAWKLDPSLEGLLDWSHKEDVYIGQFVPKWRSSRRVMIAERDFETGEVVLSVPINATITGEFLTTDAELACYIIRSARKGDEAKFAPYFKSLPSQFDLGSPISSSYHPFYYLGVRDNEKRTCLDGSSFLQGWDEFQQSLRAEFELGQKICGATRGGGKALAWAEFVWAMVLVKSRDVGITVNGRTAIVPFADLFNHRNAGSSNVRCAYSNAHLAVKCTVTNHVQEGSELTISYGKASNTLLFLLYGFTVEENNILPSVVVPPSSHWPLKHLAMDVLGDEESDDPSVAEQSPPPKADLNWASVSKLLGRLRWLAGQRGDSCADSACELDVHHDVSVEENVLKAVLQEAEHQLVKFPHLQSITATTDMDCRRVWLDEMHVWQGLRQFSSEALVLVSHSASLESVKEHLWPSFVLEEHKAICDKGELPRGIVNRVTYSMDCGRAVYQSYLNNTLVPMLIDAAATEAAESIASVSSELDTRSTGTFDSERSDSEGDTMDEEKPDVPRVQSESGASLGTKTEVTTPQEEFHI